MMFWFIGIYLLLELVSGSQGKGDKDLSSGGKSERRKARKPRSSSEGSLSTSVPRYSDLILKKLHFTEEDVLTGKVEVAPIQKQSSYDSLVDCNEIQPSSPGPGVKGTHDDNPRRLGIVMRKNTPLSVVASWDAVKYSSDGDEPLRPSTPTSTYFTAKHERRHNSTAGIKVKMSKPKISKDDS